MSDHVIARISALFERAACASVVGGPSQEPAMVAAVTEIVRLLDGQDVGGDAFRLAVRQAVRLSASDLAAAVARLAADWESLTSGSTVPAVAATACDDELTMLQADPELAGMFLGEALDHLASIERLALRLESTPEDAELLNDVFRPFHTIKGNAGALGVTSIQEVAHKIESLLDRARAGKLRIDRDGIDVVLRGVDLVKSQLSDLGQRLAGAPGQDSRAQREVLIAAVDRVIEQGETAAPSAADAHSAPMEQTLFRRSDDSPHAAVKVDTRKLDSLVDMVGELVIAQAIINEDPALQAVLDERLARNLAQLKRITSDLQRSAMSLRMVPIRPTFQKMTRLVRDLSRQSGKPIEIELSGEDTELDRRLVEDISDPLVHMIRNSVDHAIEPADLRARRGKPPVGRLSLSAVHQGGNILISLSDDGAGLNTEKILQRATARGLVQPGAQLTPAEIHQLIFEPGFTTTDRVTEISGRGVGMDVVRRNLESLRGRIEIQTREGEGTTFVLRLPLTLAIIDGLLLGVGTERFVLPAFSIRESLRPTANQIHRVQGRPRLITIRNAVLPLVPLADLFHVKADVHEPTDATVVIVEEGGRRLALMVDRLLGKQEVVIKPLGDAFAHVRGVSGGAILGDGRIGLILDAHGLMALHQDVATAA